MRRRTISKEAAAAAAVLEPGSPGINVVVLARDNNASEDALEKLRFFCAK